MDGIPQGLADFAPLTDADRTRAANIPTGGGPAGTGDAADAVEIMPYPEQNPAPLDFKHREYGEPSRISVYRTEQGAPIVVAVRYNFTKPDGIPGKIVLPFTFGRRVGTARNGEPQTRIAWHWKAPPSPRPLYGLDQLATRPDAAVLVCEGEPAVDAASALFPDMVCITSQGGSKAPDKSDWTPLRGRTVTIWPDHDEAGAAYAAKVAELAMAAGAVSVRTVEVPADWPEKWDLADALPEGTTEALLHEMLADAAESTAHDAGGQSSASQGESDEAAIARLAKLSALEYERVRTAEAERMGLRATILDKLVEQARGDDRSGHGRGVLLHDPELWEAPVSTGDLLNHMVDAIRRHVVLHQLVADAIALWIAHTWVADRFEHSPRLGITSPTRRCGKSTLLDVLRATCRRTLKADNISASGIFRTVEALRPLTLLVDEADSFLKDNEELRGVLNSGFERSGSVIRVVEKQGEHQPMQFATFCPVALAAIGDLPSTIADRALPVRMERKAPGDASQKLRAGNNRGALAALARQAARWARDNGASLAADPALPDALNDREGDISVPLAAIADHAGGEWPQRGRRALLHIFGLRSEHDGNMETGALLLADIKAIFSENSALRLPSADLCTHLGKLDDRPWPEWRAGKPITPAQLATALRPFDVRPTTYRNGETTHKGYLKGAFEDAWNRYLHTPATPSQPRQGAENRNTRNTTAKSNSYSENSTVTQKSPLHSIISQRCSLEQQCYGVTGAAPLEGENESANEEIEV